MRQSTSRVKRIWNWIGSEKDALIVLLMLGAAIVAVCGIQSGGNSIKAVISSIDRTASLSWRPFAMLDNTEWTLDTCWYLIKEDLKETLELSGTGAGSGVEFSLISDATVVERDTVLYQHVRFIRYPLNSIVFQESAFDHITFIGTKILRRLHIHNTGKTPLTVTYLIKSFLTFDEWNSKLNKSPKELVLLIRSSDDWVPNSTDIIVFPNSSWTSNKLDGWARKVDLKELKDIWGKPDTSAIFYPYTYAVYTDPYRNTYSSLMIEGMRASFSVYDGIVMPVMSDSGWLEKLVWDIEEEI